MKRRTAIVRILRRHPKRRIGPKCFLYLSFVCMKIPEKYVPLSREYRLICRNFLVEIGLLKYQLGPVLQEDTRDFVRAFCEVGVGNPYFCPPVKIQFPQTAMVPTTQLFRNYISNCLASKDFRKALVVYDNSLILLNGKTLQLPYIGDVINCLTNALDDENITPSTLNLVEFENADLEPALNYAESYDIVFFIVPFHRLVSQKFYDLLRQRESLSRCAIIRMFHLHKDTVSALDIDYHSIHKDCEELSKTLEQAKNIELYEEGGTDVVLNIEAQPVHKVTGFIDGQQRMTRLPAGEVYISPLKLGTSGRIVLGKNVRINGTSHSMQANIVIKNGRILEVQTRDSSLLSFVKELKEYSPLMFNLCEIGIGVNPKAIPRFTKGLCPSLCSVAAGHIHLAFGFSEPIGGTNRSSKNEYWMLTIRNPTLSAEQDRKIIQEGAMCIYVKSQDILPVVQR